MSFSPAQQFQELLKKTSTPLLLLPAYPSRDALATAFALTLFLENSGKDVALAGDTLLTDVQDLSFLATPKNLLASLVGARDFVLSFNTKQNKISNVRTEHIDHELRIYLTPDHGAIDPRDFSFIPAQFKFDLVIVIGAPDKERLGKIYEENPDIFYEVPVVNIDNHPDNELFGQVNLVDIIASSVAEIVSDILEKGAPNLVDGRVHESLLTGIIAATDSFQKKNTTPKALQIASRLMDHGADQQKIIRSLYKTQPLHLLKLWGRVMSQVKWNESLKLIWAQVSIEDLVQSRARVEDLPLVLEKIRSNYSSAQLFLILHPETNTRVTGIARATSTDALGVFSKHFTGSLRGDVFQFSLDANSLDEAEHIVIGALTVPPSA